MRRQICIRQQSSSALRNRSQRDIVERMLDQEQRGSDRRLIPLA